MADGSPAGRDPSDFSLFTLPVTFRLVAAVKTVSTTMLYGCVFFAVVLWFEVAFNHASPSFTEFYESNGWVHWWVTRAMIPAQLAGAATVLFLVGFRIGSLPGYREPSARWLGGKAALYAGAALLAAWAAMRCPGGALARWVPFGAALLLPWRLRRWLANFRVRKVRRPTMAGFRPNRRAALSFRSYVALQNLDAALPSGSSFPIATNITDTTPGEVADWFRRKGDFRSAAYCVARVVEYLLAHNRISDAETQVRAGLDDARVSREPVFMAARAEFLVAVGQHAGALELLRQARDRCGRPSVQLDSRLLTVVIDAGRYQDSPESRWSEWQRVGLVWKRHAGVVLLGLAADARLTVSSDPDSAMKLAYQICRLPDRLAILVSDDEFGLDNYEQARMAKGLALETVAQIYAQRGQCFDAASAFLDAYEEFEFLKDRRRGGRCMVLGFVNAIAAGYGNPDQENHALDMIRTGLQLVEDDRGTLRGEDSRASWIAAQREIYAATFQQLAGVRYQQAKAADLGLWLLESLHRSLTADLLVAHGAIDADPGLLAALAELAAAEASALSAGQSADASRAQAEQAERDLVTLRSQVRSRLGSVREAALISDAIDTEALLMRLGDRTAILYHCWREDSGWTVHSVLVSAEHGTHVHRGYVQAPAAGTGTPWLTAAGAFDALAVGDEGVIRAIFGGVPLQDPDFPLWEEIAQALFPGSWREMLRPASGTGKHELLIVPDGPIASLPIGALPGADGRPLLESVSVALVPALSMLNLPTGQPERSSQGGQRIAVVHRDDRQASGLRGTAREAEHWLNASRRMRVIEADDQAGIEAALQAQPPPDVITISAHGTPGQREVTTGQPVLSAEVRLRDGTVLSEESALRLPWPPLVILASCWVGAGSARTGREPSGFPLSCLLRGATTVIGGTAPIPEDQTADILCRIIDDLPSGSDTLWLLHRAQAAGVRARPLSEVTAAEIAGLTAWTTAAANTAGRRPAAPSHWDARGLPRAEAATTGTLVPGAKFSQASRRVLAHASDLAHNRPVGTLEFLASAFTADNEDWTGFAIACETGEPVLPGPVREAAAGTLTAHLEQMRITITVPLANAIHRGQVAAALMHDETTLPAHVILAALLDDSTAAGQWIRKNPRSAATNWPQHLSDRILRSDLPHPQQILGPENGGAVITHGHRMTGTSITEPPGPGKRKHRWLLPATIAGLLVLTPASYTLARAIQGALTGNIHPALGYLGAVLENAHQGAFVDAVQPGSPADTAGLHAGDIITAVAGRNDDGSAAAVVAMIEGHYSGQTVILSILRYGKPTTINVTLGQRAP